MLAIPGLLKADELETRSVLETVIPQLQAGKPDYSNMQATLRAAVKQQLPAIEPRLRTLGDFVSATYEGEENGADVYGVEFTNGSNVWIIALGPTGKISALYFQ